MFWRKKGIVFVTFSTGPKYFYNMFLDIGCLTFFLSDVNLSKLTCMS